jgi:hypothetical protein
VKPRGIPGGPGPRRQALADLGHEVFRLAFIRLASRRRVRRADGRGWDEVGRGRSAPRLPRHRAVMRRVPRLARRHDDGSPVWRRAAPSLDMGIGRVIGVPRFVGRASAALAGRSEVRCCIPTLRLAPEGGRPLHARHRAAA